MTICMFVLLMSKAIREKKNASKTGTMLIYGPSTTIMLLYTDKMYDYLFLIKPFFFFFVIVAVE